MTENKKIQEFKGKYRFLSNFSPFERALGYQGVYYPTVEHFFVAMKTKDLEQRVRASCIDSPGEVKKFGRHIDLREDWEQVKFSVMTYALLFKFSEYNPTLQKKLLATGDKELIEGTWWNDRIWGIDLKTGEGENNLGKLLMMVRDYYRDPENFDKSRVDTTPFD